MKKKFLFIGVSILFFSPSFLFASHLVEKARKVFSGGAKEAEKMDFFGVFFGTLEDAKNSEVLSNFIRCKSDTNRFLFLVKKALEHDYLLETVFVIEKEFLARALLSPHVKSKLFDSLLEKAGTKFENALIYDDQGNTIYHLLARSFDPYDPLWEKKFDICFRSPFSFWKKNKLGQTPLAIAALGKSPFVYERFFKAFEKQNGLVPFDKMLLYSFMRKEEWNEEWHKVLQVTVKKQEILIKFLLEVESFFAFIPSEAKIIPTKAESLSSSVCISAQDKEMLEDVLECIQGAILLISQKSYYERARNRTPRTQTMQELLLRAKNILKAIKGGEGIALSPQDIKELEESLALVKKTETDNSPGSLILSHAKWKKSMYEILEEALREEKNIFFCSLASAVGLPLEVEEQECYTPLSHLLLKKAPSISYIIPSLIRTIGEGRIKKWLCLKNREKQPILHVAIKQDFYQGGVALLKVCESYPLLKESIEALKDENGETASQFIKKWHETLESYKSSFFDNNPLLT